MSGLIQIALTGVGGRMGRTLVRVMAGDPRFRLVQAFDRPESDSLGSDPGALAGVAPLGFATTLFSEQALTSDAVLIDFTRPQATVAHVEACARRGVAAVVGTTGLDTAEQAVLARAATRIPIMHSANMSPGVNVCFRLVEMATRALGHDADIEVIEAHHRHKVDAPSGTALRFGEVAAAARGMALAGHAVFGRQGRDAARAPGEIGFSAVRGGDIVGDHTILFALAGERVEITHRASTRDNFAHGALLAAAWLVGRAPGLYDMQDVLNLRE